MYTHTHICCTDNLSNVLIKEYALKKNFKERSLYPTPHSSQAYSPFLKIQKGNVHGKRCLHM